MEGIYIFDDITKLCMANLRNISYNTAKYPKPSGKITYYGELLDSVDLTEVNEDVYQIITSAIEAYRIEHARAKFTKIPMEREKETVELIKKHR